MGKLPWYNPYFRNIKVGLADLAAEKSVSITALGSDKSLSLFSKFIGNVRLQNIGNYYAFYGEAKSSVSGQSTRLYVSLFAEDYPAGTIEDTSPAGLSGHVASRSQPTTWNQYSVIRTGILSISDTDLTPPFPLWFIVWLFGQESGVSFVSSCRNVKTASMVTCFF